jgi:hypothetical protein
MAYNDIVVRGVAEGKRRSFRAYCVMNGYTITDAIKVLVDQVIEGKLRLPKKGEK